MTRTERRMRRIRITMALLAGLAICACAPDDPGQATARTGATASAEWDSFVEGYIEEFFAAHPAAAVVHGRHEYDGQLPDWSRRGIENEIARLKRARAHAGSFSDDALDEERRFQRDYLLAVIDGTLFWLETAEWPFRSPAFYFDWMLDSLDPSPYITRTYAPPAERLGAVTTYLGNIPTAAAQIRANLRTPLPATYVEYGIRAFGGLADFYRDELALAFAAVTDEALLDAFHEARAPAIQAMDELRTWLQGEREDASDEFALGPALFRQMLKDTEGVDIGLAELEAIGRADLERNLGSLRAACASFAPGRDLAGCVAQMSANKPAGGAVQAARAQLDGLKEFVIARDLVSIPADEEAQVRESPPYARWNFAYISIPGPYEAEQPAVYYIAPPDPAWPEEVQHDYVPGEASLLFVSAHEVWPGHFLNFLHAKRSDWVFGRLFVGYAFAEGWAHYAEELMWDAGLGDGDPEVHIGQLSNALLRNVRFLSALGLHTGGMSLEESQALFMEAGLQDEGTAMQQAARGTFDPAYLNYTLGKLLILQLRDDWSRERGGPAAWKEFHDSFLSFGGPPIPLVRARMLGGEPEARFWTGD